MLGWSVNIPGETFAPYRVQNCTESDRGKKGVIVSLSTVPIQSGDMSCPKSPKKSLSKPKAGLTLPRCQFSALFFFFLLLDLKGFA